MMDEATAGVDMDTDLLIQHTTVRTSFKHCTVLAKPRTGSTPSLL
jgi:ABC-type multidrug transport system fused ATPase/permease subunit